jgi:hypothetical protein
MDPFWLGSTSSFFPFLGGLGFKKQSVYKVLGRPCPFGSTFGALGSLRPLFWSWGRFALLSKGAPFDLALLWKNYHQMIN